MDKKRIIFGLPLFIGVIIYAIISIYNNQNESKKERERLSKEYKILLKPDSINDKVSSTYYPEIWGGLGCSYITFDNGQKFEICATELSNNGLYFQEIVKKGFVIKKESNTDTIIVKSNGDNYKFLLHSYDAKVDSLSFIEKIFR